MKKVVEFLEANPVQYLAAIGRDGKAILADFPGDPPMECSL